MEADKLYNDEGYEVTKYVNSGRTKVFYEKQEAEKHAKKIRTYLYPIYDKRGMFYGYGVPK
jgi:hypothetical protein